MLSELVPPDDYLDRSEVFDRPPVKKVRQFSTLDAFSMYRMLALEWSQIYTQDDFFLERSEVFDRPPVKKVRQFSTLDAFNMYRMLAYKVESVRHPGDLSVIDPTPHCACAEPKHGYMTHFYFSRQPAHVNDSLVLELTNRFLPDEPDQHYLACDVNVVTSQDRKLMVHFLSLEISDENTIDSTLCDGYQNCGNDDTSDEEHCSRALANTWKPVDGQVAAVVAASVSITTLILVTGVIILAVRRVNKRYIINTTNVTVEFRKKRTKKKSAKGGKQRNTENLTRLYAPPSYEVVVGMDEAPPPYHSVADEYTSSEEEDGMLVEQIDEISAGPGTCVIMPEDEHLVTENLRQACAKPPDNHIKSYVT
ncbi:hypothetical protein MAR_012469 [Mya arenaria]|uniref:Uncharacterized protein n=1 Tax=Mya arenaria TaxID=6604 RepID=A0ABY7FX50_MYAAR|nr:hypothetical protein MAR_012469 [Mya arenaria]